MLQCWQSEGKDWYLLDGLISNYVMIQEISVFQGLLCKNACMCIINISYFFSSTILNNSRPEKNTYFVDFHSFFESLAYRRSVYFFADRVSVSKSTT